MNFVSAKKVFKTLTVCFICYSLTVTAGELEVQAANKLLDVMHFEELLDESVESAVQMIVKSDRTFAKKEKNIRNLFTKLYNPDHFRKILSNSYAEAFTKEELQDLIDFYSTPTGQKFASKQTAIGMRQVEEQQKIMKAHMKDLEKILGS